LGGVFAQYLVRLGRLLCASNEKKIKEKKKETHQHHWMEPSFHG
jgi:hypothetical protein